MAMNYVTNPTFTGRITGATSEFPYGSSKNETAPAANDGMPYNLQRANDIFGFQQSLLSAAGIVPTGNPDEVGASQYLQAITELRRAASEVEPLGNKNVYFRESMVISPDAAITFPPTSGTTGDYAAGEEFVFGAWAGVSGVADVVITDNNGILWGADSIELRYDIENLTIFTQGDETVHIVDEAGVEYWLKVADVAALSSSLATNLLTVDVDFAIFAELGITSMRQIGLQDAVGFFGEKSANEVERGVRGGHILLTSGAQRGYLYPDKQVVVYGTGTASVAATTNTIPFGLVMSGDYIVFGAHTGSPGGSTFAIKIPRSTRTTTSFTAEAGGTLSIEYVLTGSVS